MFVCVCFEVGLRNMSYHIMKMLSEELFLTDDTSVFLLFFLGFFFAFVPSIPPPHHHSYAFVSEAATAAAVISFVGGVGGRRPRPLSCQLWLFVLCCVVLSCVLWHHSQILVPLPPTNPPTLQIQTGGHH